MAAYLVSKIPPFVNRNISFLWLGQLVSQAGDSITHMAVIWLMLDLTGSPSLTGFIAFAATAPALIFGLFSGVLADHYRRRTLMLISDLARFFLILLIPLFYTMDMLTPMLLAIVVFSAASFGTLFNPARDAIIPELVHESKLLKINALIQSTGYLAYFVGLFGAGMLLSAMGLVNLFFLDAGTFLISFFLIMLISYQRGEKRVSTYESRHLTELKKGLKYVIYEDRRLFWIILITALNNLFIMGPAVVGTPLLIKEVWDGSGRDFAFIESSYGVGMVIATIFVYRFASKYKKGTWLMLGIIYDGLTFIPLFWVGRLGIDPFWLTLSIILIHSLGIPFIQVTRTTLVHSMVPGHMQGRVFSMINLAVIGVMSISVALTGVLAEWISPRTIFLIIGVGAALSGLMGLSMKTIRNAD
ncbi:MAG: MFS transporter [Candidatus Marinimicrobia bacterium]|nr:MFS transporter [Candidatus Neomarinimicrobiota bacterium]MBT3632407.1 MFS transporter [Candidatus Neomarinimicrobiota bacterium]MBT3824889.1 MFS transporter [Candidatus Neomarinimicrobiota bacterium]MBT4131881.1 MFS transporter [Candidatus Neomarinimicrobiota bacterium]MBT4294588.1 MFS transporter [Candidatus Neomarinimicrobiota bacterium]